jgi:hypothetical protein
MGGEGMSGISEGHAAYMGDGAWLVVQDGDNGSESVLLRKADLEALLASYAAL